MGEPTDAVDPIKIVVAMTPCEPMVLKEAFSQLVDMLIQTQQGNIIDWDTFVMDSKRFLNPETGQVLVRMRVGVSVMEVPDE